MSKSIVVTHDNFHRISGAFHCNLSIETYVAGDFNRFNRFSLILSASRVSLDRDQFSWLKDDFKEMIRTSGSKSGDQRRRDLRRRSLGTPDFVPCQSTKAEGNSATRTNTDRSIHTNPMSNAMTTGTVGNSPSRARNNKETIPRKKACDQCSTAKVRCDHKRPQCTRCEARSIGCSFAVAGDQATTNVDDPAVGIGSSSEILEAYQIASEDSTTISSGATPLSNSASFVASAISSPFPPVNQDGIRSAISSNCMRHDFNHRAEPETSTWESSAFDFSALNLLCTIDATQIRNRWLNDFIPPVNQRQKNYPPSIIHLISRVLKTYPAMLLRKEGLPPFVHPSQIASSATPVPLANCFSLVRLWNGQVSGSEAIVRDTIRREMERLYQEVRSAPLTPITY